LFYYYSDYITIYFLLRERGRDRGREGVTETERETKRGGKVELIRERENK